MVDQFPKSGANQLIWQSGKQGAELASSTLSEKDLAVVSNPFINRMDLAYAAADIIISRAGAMSISELCIVGKPVILVPSPNVAEDHQTKNAMALVERGAAILVKDTNAASELKPVLFELLENGAKQDSLA